MRLVWDAWRRDGTFMDQARRPYEGTDFATIHWSAMRTTFVNENGGLGELYRSAATWGWSAAIEARNRRQFGYTTPDRDLMLRDGDFKYRTRPTLQNPQPYLIFGSYTSGRSDTFAEAEINGKKIWYDIPNILATGQARFGTGATAVDRMVWFVGALTLHEIMHNHGFDHPAVANWTPGSEYASSLPHVALAALLRASPHSAFFDRWIDIMIADKSVQLFGSRRIGNVDQEASRRANELIARLNIDAQREEQKSPPDANDIDRDKSV